jgi:hypothetical protein
MQRAADCTATADRVAAANMGTAAGNCFQQGSLNSLNKLQEARRSVGFERTPDGRVLLLTEDGEPFQVKNDMGVPGLLLLR